MIKSQWILVCVLMAFGCATSTSSRKASSGEPPQANGPKTSDATAPANHDAVKAELTRMLSREFEPLPTREVHALQGKLSAKIEAASEPTIKPGSGFDELTVPVGTKSPIHCYLRPFAIDPASALWKVGSAVKTQYQIEFSPAPEIAVANDAPVMFLNLLYLVPQGGQKKLGMFKEAVYTQHWGSFLCFQDEAGYSESFARVMKGLAESLTPTNAAPEPARYLEISVTHLGKLVVGCEVRRIVDDENGHASLVSRTSMLIPRTASDVMASDTYSRDAVDGSGTLLGKRYVNTVNGDVTTRIDLKAEARHRYHYEGIFNGKPVTGTLATKHGLSSDLLEARVMKQKILEGAADELHFDDYSPGEDPTSVADVVVHRDRSRPRGVTVDDGPMHLTGVLAADGFAEESRLSVGDRELIQRVILTRGQP